MDMRRIAWSLFLGLAAGLSPASAETPNATFASAPGQACPPEKTVYQDVICHRCKLVPETKQIRKTVYEVQEVPFCLKKLPPLFGHHASGCDCAMLAKCDLPTLQEGAGKEGNRLSRNLHLEMRD